MKKLMTMMLGLALVAGTASYSFAQGDKDSKTTSKKKGGKGGACADKSTPKDGKCADGSAPAAGKGGKGGKKDKDKATK